MAKRTKIAGLGVLVLRIGIGGLFVYAGLLKALDPSQFLRDVESYRLLPYLGAVSLAMYLPCLEVLGGGAVMLRKFYPGGILILLLLTILFTIALTTSWLRGLDISCGCFGTRGGAASYPWLLARDLLILGGLLILWRMGRRDFSSG